MITNLNTMSPARARTWTTRSANHEASAPPKMRRTDSLLCTLIPIAHFASLKWVALLAREKKGSEGIFLDPWTFSCYVCSHNAVIYCTGLSIVAIGVGFNESLVNVSISVGHRKRW